MLGRHATPLTLSGFELLGSSSRGGFDYGDSGGAFVLLSWVVSAGSSASALLAGSPSRKPTDRNVRSPETEKTSCVLLGLVTS